MSNAPIVPENILKRELVFSTYCSSPNHEDDFLLAKERLFLADGTTVPNIRKIKNYKRKFWVTKPHLRNHKDKKEFEYFDNLDEYECTEKELPSKIFYALNGYYPRGHVNLRDLYKSQFVYGTNPTLNSLLKKGYKKKWPDANGQYTLAVMDYEWDVINGTGDIVSGVLSFKGMLHIAVVKSFLGDYAKGAEALLKETMNKYLSKFITERNIVPIITIVDSPADVVIELFKSAHKWKPDILGFWSIAADIDKCIYQLKKANIDPAIVFSDPSVHNDFKFYNWVKDSPRKTKSNGDVQSKNFDDLWHKLTFPASFYPVCLKALYKLIRAAEKNKTSYALDEILNDELGFGKFKIEGIADNLSSIDWHKYMQKNNPIEYVAAYMPIDAIGPEMLDEKTKDAALSFNIFSRGSDFLNFNSNPTKLSECVGDMTREAGIGVLCAVGGSMKTPLDDMTPTLNGMIITLPSELVYKMGNNLINEDANMRTRITVAGGDIDVKSAYPRGGINMNVSVATRAYEVCSVDGMTLYELRSIGINMSNLKGNALSIAKRTHNYPELNKLLTDFKRDKKISA